MGRLVWRLRLGAGVVLALALTAGATAGDDDWRPLFNGRDLEGWTVKVAGHPLGENYAGTFRVEDGVIKVAYDRYGAFDGQFAHLYTNVAYSRYVLQLEYRFTGSSVAGAPEWAGFNSGVMVHTQSPLSVTLEQAFPVSLEFQFLAAGTRAGRQTGNACTPGTHLERNGRLITDHVVEASGRLHPLDEWVAVEVEVRGNEEVVHRVNGVEVLRYRHPQLDPGDADAERLLAAGAPRRLSFGHIALQAEGHPVWFRNIRIRPLGP